MQIEKLSGVTWPGIVQRNRLFVAQRTFLIGLAPDKGARDQLVRRRLSPVGVNFPLASLTGPRGLRIGRSR